MFENLNSHYILFLLIATRLSGAFLFNPILGRRNVPAILKVGLSLLIAVGVFPTLEPVSSQIDSVTIFILIILKELLVGYGIGLIIHLFISSLIIAGENIDMQIGLGMGKMYDPQSNVSMALTGTFYNILFTAMFFISDSHLTLIRIITRSCKLFPVGNDFFNFDAGSYIVLLFGDILILALKIAIPVIIIELLTEAGLGVLMRIVQHINIFALGLQVKLAVGLIVVILTLPVVSKIIDSSITYMFERIQEGINIMLSAP